MVNRLLDQYGHRLALFGILLAALVLRLYGQNWDQGQYLHPDERFIAIVSSGRVSFPSIDKIDTIFDPSDSPLNPRRNSADGNPESFAYGTLPIYVQGAVSWALDSVWDRDWGAYSQLYRVGRSLSAIFDIATVVLTYLIARRLFSRAAGLIAAGFYSFAVLPIQLSHFFTVDIWLTTFVTATIYLSIRFLDNPTAGRAAALGAVVGFACATKASIPSLILPLAAVFAYSFLTNDRRPAIVKTAIVGAVAAVVTFTLFEPYAIVNRGPFIDDIRTQARIVRGVYDVPFTRQFVGLTPGLYELENLLRYSIGPGFLIAGLFGVVYGVRRVIKTRDPAIAVIIIWIASYVPVLLITEARFLRYSLPLLPILAVLAAGALAAGLESIRWKRTAQTVTVAALSLTAVWGIGFASIYSSTNPRIAASDWIYKNIPPGSTITAESWDDPLPLRIDGNQSSIYNIRFMDIYGDEPPEQKVSSLYDTLQGVDYVILSSDRIVGSVDNLPWRYAVQNEYYRRLIEGQLGFQLVYEADLQPELFGVRYDDFGADESFWVYDHPRVRIFQRIEHLTETQFRERLLWGINQPWEPSRYPTQKRLMLGAPVETISVTRDSEFNGFAVDHGWFAVASWLFIVEFIGLAVLPLTAAILKRSPDRGALSTRILGILIVAWIVWIGGSLDLWPVRSLTAATGIFIVGMTTWISYVYLRRAGRAPALPSVRAYSLCSALFLILFALFLGFRLYYPDFWQTYLGGEKPFELAYLRAVNQSTSFPPYDPWYADGVINYYYYGWHIVATLTKLSGIGVSNGFQLAAATLPALFGIQVVALGLLLYRQRRSLSIWSGKAVAAALVLVMVLFVGNLDAVHQLWTIRKESGVQFDFWRSTRVIDFTINEFPYFTAIWADVHPHLMNFPTIALLLTLLVSVTISAKDLSGSLQLGYKSLLLPIFVLVLTLGTVFVVNSWDAPVSAVIAIATFIYAGLLVNKRTAVLFTGIGIAVAAMALAIFSPFYVGFYSVAEGVARADAGSDLVQFLTVWGIFYVVILSAIGFECIRRYRDSWDRVEGWLASTLVLAAGGISAIAFSNRSESYSSGTFLIVLVSAAIIISFAATATRALRFHPLILGMVVILVVLSASLAADRPAAAFALAIATASAMFAVRRWRSPSEFLPWALVAAGAVTISATEFVYIVDDLQYGPWQRMNTVFKFSLQAWILIAVGSAILLANLWRATGISIRSAIASRAVGVVVQANRPVDEINAKSAVVRATSKSAIAFASIATLFVIAGLAYPILGTPVRLRQTMPTTPDYLTLDGYAWMEGGSIVNGTGETIDFSGDLAAIEWLNEHANGAEVIVEAAIGPYRGNGSRISSGTGLPTIIGWDRHQRQQRYQDGINQRMNDVRTIYNTVDPDEKMALLRRYRVKYVVVGDIERLWNTPEDQTTYASKAGLEAFESLVGHGLQMAFESGHTRIYRVDDFPRLPQAPGAIHQL